MALVQNINIIINEKLLNAIRAIMRRAEVVRNHYKDKDTLNYGEMDSYLLAEECYKQIELLNKEGDITVVTKEQYDIAVKNKEESEKIINEWFKQKALNFEERMKTNPIFTDDELFYSATARCPCGAGLAYPKDCGGFHYWDCSAILKGIQDNNVKHTDQLPFTFYEIHGESDYRGTTRPKKE